MKRFLGWAAIIVLVLGGIAYCGAGYSQQQPPQAVSLEYYQDRLATCDFTAAQLRAERDRLKVRLEAELAKNKEKPAEGSKP